MQKLLRFLMQEFIKMIPTALFFFVAYLLVDATFAVIKKQELSSYPIFYSLVSGLIMAKVVLIADYISLTNRFSHKPLAYITLWKSFIYVLFSIVLRLFEHVIPALYKGTSFDEIATAIAQHATQPIFWVGQCWLAYLFIIFVGYRELITKVGPAKVKTLFFGK